jgi:hypothetical protein
VISDSISRAHRIERVPDHWLTAPGMSHGRSHETQNAEQLSSTNPIIGNGAVNQRACKMWFRIQHRVEDSVRSPLFRSGPCALPIDVLHLGILVVPVNCMIRLATEFGQPLVEDLYLLTILLATYGLSSHFSNTYLWYLSRTASTSSGSAK